MPFFLFSACPLLCRTAFSRSLPISFLGCFALRCLCCIHLSCAAFRCLCCISLSLLALSLFALHPVLLLSVVIIIFLAFPVRLNPQKEWLHNASQFRWMLVRMQFQLQGAETQFSCPLFH